MWAYYARLLVQYGFQYFRFNVLIIYFFLINVKITVLLKNN